MEIEYWEEPKRVLLIAEVTMNSESQISVTGLSVIVYINGIDHDLTKGFSENFLKSYEERIRVHAFDKYFEDLKAERDGVSDTWDGDPAA